MKTKVFAKLKPKVASLGFNTKELQGVAAKIADNLGSEDATDEDIDAAIDAAIPYLGFGQSFASRVINEEKAKNANPKPGEGDDTPPADSAKNPQQTDLEKQIASLMKTVETLTGEVQGFKAKDVAATRKSRLEEVVKDAGTISAKALKDFSRMQFESEEDFEAYLEETKADIDAFKQDQANDGLRRLPKPPGVSSGKGDEIDPMVKERIESRKAETAAPAIAGLPQTN